MHHSRGLFALSAHVCSLARAVLLAMGLVGLVGMIGVSPGVAAQDDLLRLLAERLLVQGAAPGGVPQTVELLPGQVPQGVPPFPQPPGSRIIGTAIRRNGTEVSQIEVVLDVPEGVDAGRFYRDELPRQGFTLAPTTVAEGPARGFVATQGTSSTTYFCRGPVAPFLTVSTFLRQNAPLDVRVRLDATSAGPCTAGTNLTPPDTNGAERVPSLAAPQGVMVQLSPAPGIAPNRYVNEATAFTARPVMDLESEFAAQLVAAGWTRTGGAAAGPFAFSTWRVPGGGDATGLLTVQEVPGGDRRLLHIEVNTDARI